MSRIRENEYRRNQRFDRVLQPCSFCENPSSTVREPASSTLNGNLGICANKADCSGYKVGLD
jgi:hypothetical protein